MNSVMRRLSQTGKIFLVSATGLTGLAYGYEAHEWGTFTALVGSTGKTQAGMYHEDEELPEFVHRYGATSLRIDAKNKLMGCWTGDCDSPRPQPPAPPVPLPRPPSPPIPPCRGKGCFDNVFYDTQRVTQKMETPVIYFYGQGGEKVSVDVRFPQGIVTETYPAPSFSFPSTRNPDLRATGRTLFDIEILNEKEGDIPFVAHDNIYGHAREVNSNLIQSLARDAGQSEREKFIFYRGLAQFDPIPSITSQGSSVSIQTEGDRDAPLAMYLVHVDGYGDARGLKLDSKRVVKVSEERVEELMDHTLKRVGRSTPVLGFTELKERMIDSLVQTGLYEDEARAMLKTWEHGYLRVPGLRVLYVMPRSEVEQVLPLTLTPAASQLERVFVARVEVMLESQEELLLAQIERMGTQFDVKTLGRFAEPMLRRIQEYRIEKRLVDAWDPMTTVLNRLIERAANAN